MSIEFDPAVQYGDYAGPFVRMDEAMLAETKAALTAGMEAIIPPEHRHEVKWIVIQPVLRETDILVDGGFVAWKYTPARKVAV